MATIEGEIVIGRPVEVVFDYVRSAVASGGRTAEMLLECTGYDRPKLFATNTTMARADISYTLKFVRAPAGPLMRWSGRVRPKGAIRLLEPVITWLGRRQEQRIWASLKDRLEAGPTSWTSGGSANSEASD